jgi:hypothetical protein
MSYLDLLWWMAILPRTIWYIWPWIYLLSIVTIIWAAIKIRKVRR